MEYTGRDRLFEGLGFRNEDEGLSPELRCLLIEQFALDDDGTLEVLLELHDMEKLSPDTRLGKEVWGYVLPRLEDQEEVVNRLSEEYRSDISRRVETLLDTQVTRGLLGLYNRPETIKFYYDRFRRVSDLLFRKKAEEKVYDRLDLCR